MQHSNEYAILERQYNEIRGNLDVVTTNLKTELKQLVSDENWTRIQLRIKNIRLVGNCCDVLQEYIEAYTNYSAEIHEKHKIDFEILLKKINLVSAQLKETTERLLIEEDANLEFQYKFNSNFENKIVKVNHSTPLKNKEKVSDHLYTELISVKKEFKDIKVFLFKKKTCSLEIDCEDAYPSLTASKRCANNKNNENVITTSFFSK